MTRVPASLRLACSFLLCLSFAVLPARADTLFGAAHPGGPTSPSTLYRINDLTGVAVPVGPIGFNAVGGMDFQPVTGKLFAIGKNGSGTNVLITIEPRTGQGTEVGTLTGVDTGTSGGLFDWSGRPVSWTRATGSGSRSPTTCS